MGFKTISLSDEAYRRLKKQKLESESFSNEVIRLTQGKGKLSDLAGLFTKEEAEDLEKGVKEVRRSAKVRTWY